MNDTAVARREVETIPATADQQDNLMQMAIQQGAGIETIERLIALRNQERERIAKEEYLAAMAKFQSELKPIEKRGKGHHGATFAKLEHIAEAIAEPMTNNGLSYRWEQTFQDGLFVVTCVISHDHGHSERYTMGAGPDDSGAKNAIQQQASTVSYLRRYTLTGALGITGTNEDDDGGKPEITVDELLLYQGKVREHFPNISVLKEALAVDDYCAAREAWLELPQEDQMILWRAPTKGGLLTTDERSKMKSNDWNAAGAQQ